MSLVFELLSACSSLTLHCTPEVKKRLHEKIHPYKIHLVHELIEDYLDGRIVGKKFKSLILGSRKPTMEYVNQRMSQNCKSVFFLLTKHLTES